MFKQFNGDNFKEKLTERYIFKCQLINSAMHNWVGNRTFTYIDQLLFILLVKISPPAHLRSSKLHYHTIFLFIVFMLKVIEKDGFEIANTIVDFSYCELGTRADFDSIKFLEAGHQAGKKVGAPGAIYPCWEANCPWFLHQIVYKRIDQWQKTLKIAKNAPGCDMLISQPAGHMYIGRKFTLQFWSQKLWQDALWVCVILLLNLCWVAPNTCLRCWQ